MDYLSKINTSPILYQDTILLIKCVPDLKTLFYKLSGYIEEPEADTLFTRVLEEIEKTKVLKLVADLTDFKGGSLILAKYMNQVWIQKLANAGIIRIAFTKPRSRFGQFTNKIATEGNVNTLLQFKEFKDLNAAFNWIEKEDDKN